MKRYLKISGLTLTTLLLFGIFFVGSLSAQTRSLIVWSQQEAENTTHNGAIAYSPDGQLVASGRSDSYDVNIWNAADGSLVRTLHGQNNNANVIRFSPDGQYLATGTGGGGQGLSLNLWRVSDGVRLVGRIGAFPNGTIGLSFSPDSQWLVASGFNQEAYKIYHVPDMSLVQTVGNFDPDLGYNTRIFAVAFSNDGQLIAVGETRGISLRRASDGSLVRAIHNLPNMMKTVSLAFSPDGSYVAGGIASKDPTYGNCIDCSIKLFRIADGALIHTYTNDTGPANAKIAFSPDGRIIGAGYADNDSIYGGAAQFWNVATEESIRRDPRDFWVQDFAYSPSGKFYAFFGADGVIAVARAPLLRGFARDEIGDQTKY